MSRGIGFTVSTFVHVAVVGAVLVNWPELPTVAEEKALPFSLSMLQSTPTLKPVEPVIEKVLPTASVIPERKKSEPEPKKVEPEVEKKEVVEVVKKTRPKVIKEKKLVKKLAPVKIPKKTQRKKPIEEKNIAKVKPAKQPDPSPVLNKTVEVSAPPPPPAQASPVAIVDGARLMTLEQQFKQALMREIEKNKFYPKRAKRRHREGVVKISFTILSDGKLNSIRIQESSGHKSLDDAAMGAVAEIARFKPIPKELGRERWEFVVPLRYELL